MNAIGKVIEVCENTAIVSSQRNSACSSCHNCESHGMCHAELVFGAQSETVTVSAKNSVNARQGDTVELESSTSKTLFVSFLLFVFPLILSCLCYFVLNKTVVSDAGYLPATLILSYFVFFVICAFISNAFVKRHTSVSIVRIIEECKQDFERK